MLVQFGLMIDWIDDAVGFESAVAVFVFPQILLMLVVGVVKRSSGCLTDLRDDRAASVFRQFLVRRRGRKRERIEGLHCGPG